MFVKNVGHLDRIIRTVVGAGLGYFAYRADGPAAYILGAAGFAALFTGLLGWCGLYRLLGRNTCKIDEP